MPGFAITVFDFTAIDQDEKRIKGILQSFVISNYVDLKAPFCSIGPLLSLVSYSKLITLVLLDPNLLCEPNHTS